MKSSGLITLFSELPPNSRRPSPFAASAILHALIFGLIWFGLHHAVVTPHPDERYTVKLLIFNQPLPRPRAETASQPELAAALGEDRTTPNPVRSQTEPRAQSQVRPEASPSASQPGRSSPRSAPQLARQATAPQTLLQPDLPKTLVAEVKLIPTVVMWEPEPKPVRQITPPPPQKPVTAMIHPSPATPNLATSISNIRVAPQPLPMQALTLPPSSTSPVRVIGSAPANHLPETASRQTTTPTPAQIVSLTNIQLEKGVAALPEINEIAPGTSGLSFANLPALSPGTGGKAPSTGTGSASEGTGSGAGAEAKNNMNGAGGTSQPGVGTTQSPGAVAGSAMPNGLGHSSLVTRIELPKTGSFGFVVVGDPSGQDDPDAPNVWGGRLVYSVYLHVGLPRNWILQYALPANPKNVPAAGQRQPKAPWPYLIVRPHLNPDDWDTDAIMIHGFVNVEGHFEKLAVVFPQQFSQAGFVIRSLDQWRFRPSTLDGQLARVEVLLIIPQQEN